MTKHDGSRSHDSIDDPLDQTVTYEDILEIIQRRHDIDSVGDNDTM